MGGGLAFLVGGLWLSPDLDTRSNPTRRWGPLRLLWWPYRRLLRHRSLLSHSPLLGTAGRLLYLLALVLGLHGMTNGARDVTLRTLALACISLATATASCAGSSAHAVLRKPL